MDGRRGWMIWLRAGAILALLAIGARYLSMAWDTFHVWDTPLWPDETTVLPMWLIFVFLMLIAPLPIVGFWLLFDSRRLGAGRLRWRWWLGGLIVADFAWELATVFIHWDEVGATSIIGHFPMDYRLPFVAIIPLWILTAPRRSA